MLRAFILNIFKFQISDSLIIVYSTYKMIKSVQNPVWCLHHDDSYKTLASATSQLLDFSICLRHSLVSCVDQEGGIGDPDPPGKSRFMGFYGNKHLDPPPPGKKLDPPCKCWTPPPPPRNMLNR